jgi:hypothetical protein
MRVNRMKKTRINSFYLSGQGVELGRKKTRILSEVENTAGTSFQGLDQNYSLLDIQGNFLSTLKAKT